MPRLYRHPHHQVDFLDHDGGESDDGKNADAEMMPSHHPGALEDPRGMDAQDLEVWNGKHRAIERAEHEPPMVSDNNLKSSIIPDVVFGKDGACFGLLLAHPKVFTLQGDDGCVHHAFLEIRDDTAPQPHLEFAVVICRTCGYAKKDPSLTGKKRDRLGTMLTSAQFRAPWTNAVFFCRRCESKAMAKIQEKELSVESTRRQIEGLHTELTELSLEAGRLNDILTAHRECRN